tara:strand:+ start:134 stop:322 length:189 start_codon:yes stop_codon:yes gene_type:complete
MEYLKKALANLDKLNMHVKRVRSNLEGVFITPLDTHYIMQNEKIVHVGTEDTVVEFALRLRT